MARTGRTAKESRRAPHSSPAPSPPRFDLLVEPLLGVEDAGGERGAVSLPEVLALLDRDRVRAFTGMQAHQRHGWHAFLVQLAAIALHRAGEVAAPQDADRWRELLLALTRGAIEPWCLVVEDLSRPAFMQPPVPEGTLAGFKEECFPDALDVLVTSKNHDVKAARVVSPRPEHWVYALVTLQTMQGYTGSSNYGIARMNGGQSSRASVGLAPSLAPGARFRRDVEVVLAARDGIATGHGYPRRNGLALLWCEGWDGKDALALDALDPLFIDVCRRVRLVSDGAGMRAVRTGTECERVLAKDAKGNTGDPWSPVQAREGKSFTASKAGFGYRVVQRLLGEEYEPGCALVPGERETGVLLVATVLARGQGKTAGFHERVLPVPRKVASVLRRPEGRRELGALAKERVDLVSTVENRVLRPALKVLLQGGPEKLKQDDDRPSPWVDACDAEVDAIFFERLWADHGRNPADAAREWAQEVVALARRQLGAAIEDAPVPAARRYRAIATAERVFEGAARNHVPIAYPPREVPHAG